MESSHYLREFYENLDTGKNDFRNVNLNKYLLDRVTGSRILDIGCGFGYFLFLNKQQGREVCGIELNKQIADLGSEAFGDLNIHISDLENIGECFRDIDCISVIDVLEHIERDEKLLADIHDVLPDSGRLILVVPALPSLYGQRDKNAGHFRRYSRNNLKIKLESAGFEIVELRYWNFIAVILYFISEKIFRKELNSNLRGSGKGLMRGYLNRNLNWWFENVENRYNFGIGLSLICIADRHSSSKHMPSTPLQGQNCLEK